MGMDEQIVEVSLGSKFGVGLYIIGLCLSVATITHLLISGKRNAALKSHIACQALICVWLFFGIFNEFATNNRDFYITSRLAFFPICYIGVAWFIFCVFYTGRVLSRKVIILLLICPFLFSISAITNYGRLFIQAKSIGKPPTWGIVFWLQFFYSYTAIIIGSCLVVAHGVKQFGYFKKQSILLVFAVLFPLSINLVQVVVMPQSTNFDLTPAAYSFSLALLAVATFKYRFLNIVPIAQKEIMRNMKECIVVIDNYDNIIDYNSSFADTFGKFVPIARNQKVNVFIQWLKTVTEDSGTANHIIDSITNSNMSYVEGELKLIDTEKKCFFVYVCSIMTRKNDTLGRVVSFSDITGYKNLLEEVGKKNLELIAANEDLIAANEKLKDYADTVEELAIASERNRFARDVHDTLGHAMTVLISMLETIRINFEKEPDRVKEMLVKTVEIARNGLEELRQSISGFTTQKLGTTSLIKALRSLMIEYESSGVKIDFSIEGEWDFNDHTYSEAIYRSCQEAMTNALRHGKATKVTIILQAVVGSIKLFIFDDGIGCKKIEKGYGLSGMEQRIKNLNGSIIYGSDGEKGFNINIEIPVKQ